jgi:uncharacterized membrane protein
MKLSLNQRYFLGAAAVILAALAGTIVAYPQLPPTVPLHWNAMGQINGWGPKWSLFLVGPGIMTALVLLFAALPWLSPKRFEVDSFRSTYLYIMLVAIAMLAYVHLLIIGAALGITYDVSRAIEGGVCLLLALIGNVMGKVRRNFYVGIRTPWTIADERVWHRTHRLAAKTLVAGGIAGLIAILFRAPFWIPLALILVSAFVPAIYSLVFYKQLEHRGEVNG